MTVTGRDRCHPVHRRDDLIEMSSDADPWISTPLSLSPTVGRRIKDWRSVFTPSTSSNSVGVALTLYAGSCGVDIHEVSISGPPRS